MIVRLNGVSEFTIEPNEDGRGEHTRLFASVFDDSVELLPFYCKGDTDSTIDDRIKKFADRFDTDPSQKKFFDVVILDRSGRARPVLASCTPPSYKPRGTELALKAAEELYDLVWPDVAKVFREFVQGMVAYIHSEDSLFGNSLARDIVASGAIDQATQAASIGDMLLKLLFEEEKDFLANGAIAQKIGFFTERGISSIIAVPVPYEKYRWGRAVAEIARKVNARRIIQITEAVSRERKGEEILVASSIKPDGSIEASAGGIYEKRGGRVHVKQGIRVVDLSKERSSQRLIPGWEVSASIP